MPYSILSRTTSSTKIDQLKNTAVNQVKRLCPGWSFIVIFSTMFHMYIKTWFHVYISCCSYIGISPAADASVNLWLWSHRYLLYWAMAPWVHLLPRFHQCIQNKRNIQLHVRITILILIHGKQSNTLLSIIYLNSSYY